ncbi:MAG: signal peptidase I [Myxococcales bacterium]|nr:signal peptidase I [Myxococcales bacterium]
MNALRPLFEPVARPRHLAIAVGLGLLMPGLGHVYAGEVGRGLKVWAAVLLAWVACLLGWARWIFAPHLPAAVLGLAWLGLQAVLARDVARAVGRAGRGFRPGPLNHPVAYLSIALGLGVLPVAASLHAVGAAFVGSVRVAGAAMFPHLLPGDELLFDRAAYRDRSPRAGELVVVDGPAGGLAVARVVATPGQVIQWRGGRPVIDGRRLDQEAITDLAVARFDAVDQARLASLDGFVEANAGRRYVVTYDAGSAVTLDPVPVHLGADELFVWGDNRDAARDERAGGVVRLASVRGRPSCIWASRDAAGAARAGRAGLEVR